MFDLYIWAAFWTKQTYSPFWSIIAPGIWYDFCNSVSIFSDQLFSDREGKAEDDRETKLILGMLCVGIFSDSGNSFLWNHDCRTLLYWNCWSAFVCAFLNREYFRRIMITGIISVFLAVLPMGIAFAGGTPLQGSLGWGLSVINGGKTDTSDDEQDESDSTDIQSMTIEDDGCKSLSEIHESSGIADHGDKKIHR